MIDPDKYKKIVDYLVETFGKEEAAKIVMTTTHINFNSNKEVRHRSLL